MSNDELLSLSNNKLLKNSSSSEENKAEYLRKTLLLRDITADLPRQTINSIISMANNVVNFFSLGIIEKDSFPTIKDNSVLKDSEKYGYYNSKEELTKDIQENKKELYLETGTYNPSANFIADIIVDIASFVLLSKTGMNTTSALATSSAVDTLGETGSVEDAAKAVVSSYLFSKILDSKLANKIQETSSGKISKFIEEITTKNPEIVNSQLKKDIAEALPDVLSNFTSVGISRSVAGESNAIMQQGKEALNSDTQKNILLDSMVWATFSAGLTGYKGVKLKIENKEMEKAKIDNLYRDLGLDPSNTYTIDELNAQYKKLSKQNHPDLAHGNKKLQAQYTEKMQQINSSYNQLKQYLTEHKLYEPEFKAFPTNDDIDVGYILKNLDDGVKILKDNTIYVDTNNALMNTAKSIANSQIINTTVPIIQDNQVIGFSKERVVPFNVENSKIDVFPGITLSEDGTIDVIDINSGARLLTNAKDIQTAINSVTDGLRNPDEKKISFINNSINKSKFESLKAIEQIASAIQNRASQIETNNKENNETLQDIQKSINSIGNDTVYSNEDTKNILNYVNDNVKNIHSFEQNGDTYINSLNKDGSIAYQQKLDKSSYKGIEIKEIVNNAIQKADLSDIKSYKSNNVGKSDNINEPEAKISNSNKEITNYTNNDIKKVIEPFAAKKSYTKKEVANIWNNISEKNYDATYDKNGNIEKYIAIENDGRNIVVNKYNNNDEIEKSIAVHNENGEFLADEIQDAITRVSSNIDLEPYIQEMAINFQENLAKQADKSLQDTNNIADSSRKYSNNIANIDSNVKAIQEFKNAKNTVPRETIVSIANNLNIEIKKGAKKILNTEMSKRAGKNKEPKIIHISNLFENLTDSKAKSFRKEAINVAMKLFRDTEVTIRDTNTIAEINKKGITKTFSNNVTNTKIQTANDLPNIIEQGIYGYSTQDLTDANKILYHHFFTPVRFNKNNGIIRVVIKEFTQDKTQKDKFYYHQLEYISNKKIEGLLGTLPHKNMETRHFKPAPSNEVDVARFQLPRSINDTTNIKDSNIKDIIPQTVKTVKNDKDISNNSMQNNENNLQKKETNQISNNNIQDFGEKIGGARKDLSIKRDTVETKKEIIHNYTTQKSEDGYSVNFKGKVLKSGFSTQQEAEKYILDFKENIKNNLAFVEEGKNRKNETTYAIKIRNPRTLKAEYTNKMFKNKEDADSYALALSMYLKENGKNLARPTIQKIDRINLRSKNSTNTTGNDILNNFGFKGGEFGNWVNQNERQMFLNYAQDAFTDLAQALEVDPKSLGQNNEMSIAFGARGKGLTGAVAHFEPAKHVINMTRLKGAGSLAHEYGHSIDNYLSRVGGYADDGLVTNNLRNPKLSDNMKKAIDDVKKALATSVSNDIKEISSKNAIYENNRKENLKNHLNSLDKVFNGEYKKYKYNRKTKQREFVNVEVSDKQKQEYNRIKNILFDGKLDSKREITGGSLEKFQTTYAEPLETLKTLYKDVVGRKIEDDKIYWLYRYGTPSKQITSVVSSSAFSKSAVELDRMTGRKSTYYSRLDEMWARAFEAYVYDKLESKGIVNTYLVHSVNNSNYALFNPFPAGEERKNINKAFDNLIKTMKDENLFTASNDSSKNTLISSNNTIKQELHNRIQNALISKNSRKRTYLGNVETNTANIIEQLTGIDVKNKRHTLADNDIRHMINKHGNSNIESKKGQIAINVNDIEKIPDIIANYDKITKGNDNKDGQTIRYLKDYPNNTTFIVEVVPEKGNSLKIKTMWKKPVRVTNSITTPSLTSKTESGLDFSTSNKSISQKAENSKLKVNDNSNNTHYMKISKSSRQSDSSKENIHFAKKSAKKSGQQDKTKTNAERDGSYIEQEIAKIEESGTWDNSIPVTTRREIRQTIEDYLGIGIQKGHFRERAYGIYKDKRDVIRTKETKDIDTILHEAGHATDIGKRINIDKDAIADELFKAVENYGGYETEIRSVKLEEGFAEVIREYCTVPERAKVDYPQTVAALEEIRKNDASFDKFISKVQGQIYNYIHQNPRNRVVSNQSIGKQTDKPKMTKEYIKQEVMRNIYDKDYALKSAVNELEKISGKKAKASENAYYLVRLSSGIGDKISSMLSDGYIDENGNKLMPGLSQIGEILDNNPERFNDLRAYLSAKRDADYKNQDLKTGIRTTDAENVVKQFENDPQIQKASKLIRETLDGVMQYAINNGLISQESVDELKKKNAFYIPMQRVFDRQGNQVGKRGAVTEIIKARKGSERDIKDVLENVITNSSNVIQQVENNNILRALFKQGEECGLTGTIYDVIDTPMEYVGKAQLEMWRDELIKQGIDVKELDLDKTIDLFAPNNKIDSKNLITSFINENGQRVYLQFNDELVFNSIMNMDKKFMSNVLKINSWLNMPLRYGATMANLGFAIPNMISDTAQAAIYSEAGFIPVVDNALGVLDIMTSTNSAVKKFMDKVAPEYSEKINNLYKIYSQSGAMSSTRLSQYRKSTQKSMKDIYGVNKSENIGIEEKFKPLKRVLDLLTYIPEISEQSTRFEVFKKNYNYYIEKGDSETDSRILAALESRDATQDFGRTGNLSREINQLIPFSAARVGSAYTFAEKVKGNPKKIGMRIAILTAIALAIKALGYKDKEIEELNQRKKDDNFILKVGNNVITIKKPQGILRSIINLGEYIQDLFTGHIEDGKEGEKLGNWLTNAIMDNMPADSVTGLVPNMVAPLIENAINKDFYYNTSIVKSYDEDLPNSEQYYEYNSQLAILLGKALNYSPAKIDNLISGYFAGLGTSITSVMDYISGKLGLSAQKPEMGAESNSIGKRFFVNVDSNSASLDEVYNRKTELTKLKNGGTISEDETKELETLTEASNNIAKINKQIKSIKADLTTSGKEKATKIKELQQQRTDIARQALRKELINSENSSKIDLTKYYPSNNTLSKNGYTLNLTDSQKEEYSQLAQEYYTKYSKQGLYDEEKLKTKAKDYAKNELFKKYKSSLTKATK